MSVICPSCGSDKAKSENELQSIEIPYGPPATFLEVVYHCPSCGVSGDFAGENTQAIEKAVQKSIMASVVTMLEGLKTQGVTEAYLERALRLKPGSAKQWRSGLLTKESVSLLRLVYAYPWLLRVSDSNFRMDDNESSDIPRPESNGLAPS